MKHIYLCHKCNVFTMSELCTKCGSKASTLKPPKYSPEDKYAGYRRQAMQEEREKRGLI
ncbi:ribosome biogenesis protein [Candidatus Woesearchaeota archaeon]|nr:ribosome biogenesis protein [Candidatus Woesearchaeota archaeon]